MTKSATMFETSEHPYHSGGPSPNDNNVLLAILEKSFGRHVVLEIFGNEELKNLRMRWIKEGTYKALGGEPCPKTRHLTCRLMAFRPLLWNANEVMEP